MNAKPLAALAALSLLLAGCGGTPSSSSSSPSSESSKSESSSSGQTSSSSQATSSSESSSTEHIHSWGAPTYVWAEDLASCTATRVCSEDEAHKETETARSTFEVATAATCSAEGKGKFTVNFNNPAFSAQVKEVSIDKIAHTYDEGQITKYPSILEEGVKTYTCTACGDKKTEPVAKVEDKTNYTRDAELMAGLPGVFSTKAVVGDNKANAENPSTIGLPLVASPNLVDYPTYSTPAIIQGAAVNYETKTGPTEYTPIEGATLLAPYSYFRWQILEQQSTSADGVVTTHKKLSGFDASYYIVRIDVSDLIAGKSGYLHVCQENNKAMMVALGMAGGVKTEVKATDAEGKTTTAPVAKDGYWYDGDTNLNIPVAKNHTSSQAYAGTDGYWYVGGTSFAYGQGTKAASYTIEDNGKALKDANGNYMDTPYIDIILLSSAKLAAGADTGIAGAPSADIPVSFYVDDTFDYNPSLVYDPTSTDVNHPAEVAKKYFDASKAVEGTNATSYIVKGNDLQIDIAVNETIDFDEIVEYWSLDKALNYPDYDAHTLKLICEVPVLEGLRVGGIDGNARSIALDVNSFDIQIANHSQTNAAALTVEDKATLTILDHSNTVGAELAIGNNAKMEILSGGTLIIDKTCQLEVEYDAASKVIPTTPIAVSELIKKIDALPEPSALTEANRAAIEEAKALYDLLDEAQKQEVTNYQKLADCVAALPEETPLSNGEIFVRSGGKVINRGIINIEGLEVKPNQGSAAETGTTVVRDMRSAALVVEENAELENEGCLSVKGDLYCLGKLTNKGSYDEVIKGTDPDKGTVDHHCGIQITWKDDVTVLKEGSQTEYTVNPDVRPGALHIGIDAEKKVYASAELINYGDIVLAPGVLEVYGIFRNAASETRSGAVYLVTVSEAVVPITPDPANPTKLEERRQFTPPYESTFDYSHAATFENNGMITGATIEIIGNGLFGKLTPVQA